MYKFLCITLALISLLVLCIEPFAPQELGASTAAYLTEMDGAGQVAPAPGYMQQRLFAGDPTKF